MADLTVRVDDEEVVVRRDGDTFSVGRSVGDDIRWLEQDLPVSRLGDEAASALDAGDVDDQALNTAIRGVVTAINDHGA